MDEQILTHCMLEAIKDLTKNCFYDYKMCIMHLLLVIWPTANSNNQKRSSD